MGLFFNFTPNNEEFTDSKKDVLKFLKVIRVDSRYISYTSSKIYINNLRFSKFSKTKEKAFKKHYPDFEILRSSLFQKICSRSSKVLSNKLNPKNCILLPKKDNSINELLAIVLEPYTRKYGVELVYEGNTDLIAKSFYLDEEVSNIFSEIFSGQGVNLENQQKNTVYPFINIPKEWLNSFLEMEEFDTIKEKEINNDFEKISNLFMSFLSEITPQYRENTLVSKEYIKKNFKS